MWVGISNLKISSLPTGLTCGLLFLLTLVRAGNLSGVEYVRMLTILTGLCIVWYKGRFSLAPTVLSTLYIVIAVQLCMSSEDGGSVCFLVFSLLTLITATGSHICGRSWQGKLSLLEWTVIGVALLIFGLSTGARILFGLEWLWPSGLQWLILPVLWILGTRWIAGTGNHGRGFGAGIQGILLVICMIGGVRAGSAYFYHLSGVRAEESGAYDRALMNYGRGAEYGQAMGLEGVYENSRMGQAKSLNELGQKERAAAVLELDKDWGRAIQPSEWEGPTGAFLFKNVSCWKDLWLCRGEVEIRLYAWGQAARGIWPRIQVRLGEHIIGEVTVTAMEERSYSFFAEIETGVQRLEIVLLNSFWELGGEHRWVKLGKAEIEYREIRW
jgi:hypothetical protein